MTGGKREERKSQRNENWFHGTWNELQRIEEACFLWRQPWKTDCEKQSKFIQLYDSSCKILSNPNMTCQPLQHSLLGGPGPSLDVGWSAAAHSRPASASLSWKPLWLLLHLWQGSPASQPCSALQSGLTRGSRLFLPASHPQTLMACTGLEVMSPSVPSLLAMLETSQPDLSTDSSQSRNSVPLDWLDVVFLPWAKRLNSCISATVDVAARTSASSILSASLM